MEHILTLILAATTTAGGPSGVELERLIDETVHLPNTTAETFWDDVPPVPCGEGVVLQAIEITPEVRLGAYYATSDGVEIVADFDTGIPGATHTFRGTGDMTCVGDRLHFLGGGSGFGGVFRWTRGGFIELIQKSDVVIDGRFVHRFFELSANRFGVAMHGLLELPSAGNVLVVKCFGDSPRIVADKTITLPGQSEPVTIYSIPQLLGPDLIFRARTSANVGLYRWSEGQGISIVADHQTPVPGSVGTFFSYGLMTVISEGLVFGATYSEGLGIFIAKGDQIEPLAVPGDVTEDGETITAALFPSGAGGLLAFSARTVEHPLESIYARTQDGKLHRILGNGDVIEGTSVAVINAGADDTNVAIRVNRSPGIIYRARFAGAPDEIPVLSGAGFVVLAMGIVLTALFLLGRRSTHAAT